MKFAFFGGDYGLKKFSKLFSGVCILNSDFYILYFANKFIDYFFINWYFIIQKGMNFNWFIGE